MRALLVTAGLAAVMVVAAVPASRAQVPSSVGPIYPWCADYGGRGGGGTNCYFSNLGQCQQAISGNGGWCYRNPFSAQASEPRDRRRSGQNYRQY
ncbi:hypothetical protein CCR97_10420 [Rhodoplanes elegans]|uniref:DUF3551 domain-containing protein n=1 Tax=Rhodoplanes elegans TaxID=29408 RepID=A0A327K1Y4_9BRAD|nr:DUF3551 domain-containing protein [Rhodoplanes elegans]MBK5958620.1 hypothetical protein [Rhodoplanes elegans]RAI32271.1 hypothetical protein CH338_24480 [Rhodoplanes elegans]